MAGWATPFFHRIITGFQVVQGSMEKSIKETLNHDMGLNYETQAWHGFASIWSNYSDLTRFFTANGGLVREIPLFQGPNLGWWNMIFFLARWHGFASIAEDGPHGARGDGLHGTVGAALAPTLGTVDFWDWFDPLPHVFKYIHRYIRTIYIFLNRVCVSTSTCICSI